MTEIAVPELFDCAVCREKIAKPDLCEHVTSHFSFRVPTCRDCAFTAATEGGMLDHEKRSKHVLKAVDNSGLYALRDAQLEKSLRSKRQPGPVVIKIEDNERNGKTDPPAAVKKKDAGAALRRVVKPESESSGEDVEDGSDFSDDDWVSSDWDLSSSSEEEGELSEASDSEEDESEEPQPKKRKVEKEAAIGEKKVCKPRSADMFYKQEHLGRVKRENPQANGVGRQKILVGEWRHLSLAEKETYKKKEAEDRQRYETEVGPRTKLNNISSYALFMKENIARINAENPDKSAKECMRLLADEWRDVDPQLKARLEKDAEKMRSQNKEKEKSAGGSTKQKGGAVGGKKSSAVGEDSQGKKGASAAAEEKKQMPKE